MSMQIGMARVDITPPLTIPYLSFYPRQTPFEGVHDRLYARVMAVEKNNERLAIVTADSLSYSRSILGPGRDFVEEVREGIELRTHIPRRHIMLACSHAHSTPQTTDLADLVRQFPHASHWLERLVAQLAAAVELAWHSRRPAELRSMVGLAPGIAWSRRIITQDGRIVRLAERPPDAEVVKEHRDDRVPVLLVSNNTWRGALIGFTCHPTTVQVQPLVSADYPGVACLQVEREFGAATCLFLQGACGNVGPVRSTTNFDDVNYYGSSLADEAIHCLSQLATRDMPPMTETLAVQSDVLDLPRRRLPDRRAVEHQLADAKAALRAARSGSEEQQAIATYRRAAAASRLLELGDGPVLCELQVMRIGEAIFVAIEGELFVEYGLQIQAHSPANVTFVSAYSNGYQGYIVTPETYEEGGYEASLGPWTRVGPNAGNQLAKRALELMKEVWG